MTNMATKMLRDDIIIPSQSPYHSRVLLVRKKEGTWRFCVDYWALNSITISLFPILTADKLLDELHGAHIFSNINLRSGYQQIHVAATNTRKMTFRTIDNHYESLVMPFRLPNASFTFQSAMNALFWDVPRKFVLIFFDDILIYSTTLEIHYQHFNHMIQTLAAHDYHAKYSKCMFACCS